MTEEEEINIMIEQEIAREEREAEAEEEKNQAYERMKAVTGITDLSKLDFVACYLHELKGTEADNPFHAMEEFELHKEIYSKYHTFLSLREVSGILKSVEEANLIKNTRRISYWVKINVSEEREAEAEEKINTAEERIENFMEEKKDTVFTFKDFFQYERLKEEKEEAVRFQEYQFNKKKYNEVAFDFLSWDKKSFPEGKHETRFRTVKQKRKYLKLSDNEQAEEILKLSEGIAKELKKR